MLLCCRACSDHCRLTLGHLSSGNPQGPLVSPGGCSDSRGNPLPQLHALLGGRARTEQGAKQALVFALKVLTCLGKADPHHPVSPPSWGRHPTWQPQSLCSHPNVLMAASASEPSFLPSPPWVPVTPMGDLQSLWAFGGNEPADTNYQLKINRKAREDRSQPQELTVSAEYFMSNSDLQDLGWVQPSRCTRPPPHTTRLLLGRPSAWLGGVPLED